MYSYRKINKTYPQQVRKV